MKKLLVRTLLTSVFIAISSHAAASDYGTTGAIDTPTARMLPDASLSSTLAYDGLTQSYSLTYQATPWLETTFRYTGFEEFFYWDRNYEAKLRLLSETEFLPELSVGIRDMFGTGVFGSEYLVASKRFGPLDASLGVGWGRLSGSPGFANPLSQLSRSFTSRSAETGRGGTLSVGDFFSGERAGFFGSLNYTIPNTDFSLLAEYNPDAYDWEARGGYEPTAPLSLGLNWHLSDGIELGFSIQNGDRVGLRLTARSDTGAETVPYKPKPAFITDAFSDLKKADGTDLDPWYADLRKEATAQGVDATRAQISDDGRLAEIEMVRGGYRSWPSAFEQMHQAADYSLPDTVRTVDYVLNEKGHRVHTLRMPRYESGLSRAIAPEPVIMPGRDISEAENAVADRSDELTVFATVDNRLMLFDPDNPLGYQLYFNLGSTYALGNNWALRGAYGFDLVNNFDDNTRVSDSVLPHVRSDGARYLKEGKTGLDHLYIEKRGSLSPYVHYRSYGGILEKMYSGLGGELLYQPYQSRLALGFSGNWVRQREYNAGLGHLDYQTVTGFGSVYWATPFYNYDAAVHVGQYLAKDKGATFELRRTFENGWMVGAWATLTDVPFETFGEGSFDKGIFLQIPFDSLLGGGEASTYNATVRPILRDGGGRLEGFSGNLWWDLREARHDVFLEGVAR